MGPHSPSRAAGNLYIYFQLVFEIDAGAGGSDAYLSPVVVLGNASLAAVQRDGPEVFRLACGAGESDHEDNVSERNRTGVDLSLVAGKSFDGSGFVCFCGGD